MILSRQGDIMNTESGTINCCSSCLLLVLFIRLNALHSPSFVDCCIWVKWILSLPDWSPVELSAGSFPNSSPGLCSWTKTKQWQLHSLQHHCCLVTWTRYLCLGTLYHATVVTTRLLNYPQPTTLKNLNVTTIHTVDNHFPIRLRMALIVMRELVSWSPHKPNGTNNNSKLFTNKQSY